MEQVANLEINSGNSFPSLTAVWLSSAEDRIRNLLKEESNNIKYAMLSCAADQPFPEINTTEGNFEFDNMLIIHWKNVNPWGILYSVFKQEFVIFSREVHSKINGERYVWKKLFVAKAEECLDTEGATLEMLKESKELRRKLRHKAILSASDKVAKFIKICIDKKIKELK